LVPRTAARSGTRKENGLGAAISRFAVPAD